MQLMADNDQFITLPLTTLLVRISVRYATYSHHYESFRKLPVCHGDTNRELQLNIAYLYHTSLSILEERKQTLEEYIMEVREVIDTFKEMLDVEKVQEIRSNMITECAEEAELLRQELRQIDKGIKTAHRHERALMTD